LNASIYNLIVAQAQARGIPPAIALAVAQQESGIEQYNSNGSLVMGSDGDTGVFQIIPSTAAGLGVDASDTNQNVQGGVTLLSQLYAQYGNWTQALSAYNSGTPNGSPSYAAKVLGLAASMFGFGASSDASAPAPVTIDSDTGQVIPPDLASGVQGPSAALLIGGVILTLGVVLWVSA